MPARVQDLQSGELEAEQLGRLPPGERHPLSGPGIFVLAASHADVPRWHLKGLGQLLSGLVGGQAHLFDEDHEMLAFSAGEIGRDFLDEKVIDILSDLSTCSWKVIRQHGGTIARTAQKARVERALKKRGQWERFSGT